MWLTQSTGRTIAVTSRSYLIIWWDDFFYQMYERLQTATYVSVCFHCLKSVSCKNANFITTQLTAVDVYCGLHISHVFRCVLRVENWHSYLKQTLIDRTAAGPLTTSWRCLFQLLRGVVVSILEDLGRELVTFTGFEHHGIVAATCGQRSEDGRER